MKNLFVKIRVWLSRLSFRTGLAVLGCCIICYLISFAQMALPLSLTWKGILWTIFFGLAKTLQYTGLLIIGKEGLKRLKSRFSKFYSSNPESNT